MFAIFLLASKPQGILSAAFSPSAALAVLTKCMGLPRGHPSDTYINHPSFQRSWPFPVSKKKNILLGGEENRYHVCPCKCLC